MTSRDKSIGRYVNFWFLCKDIGAQYTADFTYIFENHLIGNDEGKIISIIF